VFDTANLESPIHSGRGPLYGAIRVLRVVAIEAITAMLLPGLSYSITPETVKVEDGIRHLYCMRHYVTISHLSILLAIWDPHVRSFSYFFRSPKTLRQGHQVGCQLFPVKYLVDFDKNSIDLVFHLH
jgi:hypothetical protein